MKKKLILAGGLCLTLTIGSLQSASALFLGCGTKGYDTPCVAGFTTHFEQLYIFGFEVGDPQMGDTTGC